jgi:hypothetical protein
MRADLVIFIGLVEGNWTDTAGDFPDRWRMNIGKVFEESGGTCVTTEFPITREQAARFLDWYSKHRKPDFPTCALSSANTFAFSGGILTGDVMTLIERLMHELDAPANPADVIPR